jgi:prepilin-type N-terminal cleavage/methylation domain-containing protein
LHHTLFKLDAYSQIHKEGMGRPMGLKALTQRGDTIIEVMVVLAILGLALSISYATADRSLLNARQAQESSIATELAQSQIESLIPLANDPSSSANYLYIQSTTNPTTSFCISSTGNVVPFSGIYKEPNASDVGFTGYPASCISANALYHTAINYNPTAAPDDFQVTVFWNDVEGQGQDSVTLDYRVHAV